MASLKSNCLWESTQFRPGQHAKRCFNSMLCNDNQTQRVLSGHRMSWRLYNQFKKTNVCSYMEMYYKGNRWEFWYWISISPLKSTLVAKSNVRAVLCNAGSVGSAHLVFVTAHTYPTLLQGAQSQPPRLCSQWKDSRFYFAGRHSNAFSRPTLLTPHCLQLEAVPSVFTMFLSACHSCPLTCFLSL